MIRTLLPAAALLAACSSTAAAQCSTASACDSGPQVVQASYNQPARAGKDIVATAIDAGSFKTLAAALQAAGLVDALKGPGPFTVFAPTDEAFAKLPAGTVETLLKPENRATLQAILKFHVVAGKAVAADVANMKGAETLNGQRLMFDTKYGVKVNNAKVVTADIMASNGVIHVIDTVILPSTQDIIETAVAAGSFKTLAAAIDAAQLISTLKGSGPFTVFAPTDEAFAKLPAGTVESLLKPENRDKLISVLTYHVVPGRIFSDQALKAGTAQTIQGAPVRISTRGSDAYVNNAKIVKTDVQATNGVIHIIDAVILPPGF